MERPAAASVVVGIMKRRLSSLLADIARETSDASKSSKVTVMTKSGAQEVSSENLKEQVEAAVMAQRQRREKQERRKEENRDETITKLRAGKVSNDDKGGKGFQ